MLVLADVQHILGALALKLLLAIVGLLICFYLAVGLYVAGVWLINKCKDNQSIRRPIRRLRKSVRSNRKTPALGTLDHILRSIEELLLIAPDTRRVTARFAIEITMAVELAKTYNKPNRYRKQSRRNQNLLGTDHSIRERALRGLEAIEDAIVDEIGEINIRALNDADEKIDLFDEFDY